MLSGAFGKTSARTNVGIFRDLTARTMNQTLDVLPFSMSLGILLMTFSGPTLAAPDSETGGKLLITDFTSSTPDLGWYVVNDNVMGGRSEGDFRQEEGRLSFAGRTNTNGGGFSSIRTEALQLDLSNHAGIQVQVKGDGRRYTWRLTSDARWRGRPVSYWADFDTEEDAWTTVDIPFSNFIPRFRGYELDGPALDPGQITGMGVMIYDKQDGPFVLQLARVSAYSVAPPFTMSQYLWKKRVLVVSAPSRNDRNLEGQQTELAATTEAFAERDMALVTLLDDAVSTADDRELTPEEADATRTALGVQTGSFALWLIGKDGSVKFSSKKAVPMAEVYALIDTMPMRQRERDDG